MARSKMREARMKCAKISMAYLENGSPNFEAARRGGFSKISDMEAAIAEMLAEEAAENDVEFSMSTDQHSAMNGDKFLPGHEVLMDVKKVPELQPEFEPETLKGGKNLKEPVKTAHSGSFTACMFAPTPGNRHMVRLWGWKKDAFIMFEPGETDDLRKVLDDITGCSEWRQVAKTEHFPEVEKMGMKAEITRLKIESEKLRERLIEAEVNERESRAFAERAEKLLIERDQQIEDLKRALEQPVSVCENPDVAQKLREENQKLKEKLVAMIMQ